MRELQSYFLIPLKIHPQAQTQAGYSFSAMPEFLSPHLLTKKDHYAGT